MPETSRHAYCSRGGGHFPNELVASTPAIIEAFEMGIVVNSEGSATNSFENGVVGVPDWAGQEAETDDSPMCLEHREFIKEWRDIERSGQED